MSPKIGFPSFSVGGTRFAFTRDTETGVELWVGDTETLICRHLAGVTVTDVLAGPFLWSDDSRHLIAVTIPPQRGPVPAIPTVPDGPIITETEGKFSKASTFQDLLTSPADERLFAHYATTQLVRVDTETGELTPFGDPDLYYGIRLSPDEKYLLVTRLKQPFSYRVPAGYFARTVEVRDAKTGVLIRVIADMPVSDEIPQQGVLTGPRSVVWQEKKPGDPALGGRPRWRRPARQSRAPRPCNASRSAVHGRRN